MCYIIYTCRFTFDCFFQCRLSLTVHICLADFWHSCYWLSRHPFVQFTTTFYYHYRNMGHMMGEHWTYVSRLLNVRRWNKIMYAVLILSRLFKIDDLITLRLTCADCQILMWKALVKKIFFPIRFNRLILFCWDHFRCKVHHLFKLDLSHQVLLYVV